MKHPAFDDDHFRGCPDCRAEADALEAALAPPAGLRERLLDRARPRRGLLWQIPLAAAALLCLAGLLLARGPSHEIVSGRVALDDGRELAAPADLAAADPWRIRAMEPSRLRLPDGTSIALRPDARIGLKPSGARGVEADVAAGEAAFAVAPGRHRLVVASPAGRLESAGGSYSVKLVLRKEEGGDPMLAGALVTLVSGSLSLANAHGAAEARPGQAILMTASAAPVPTAAPQERQEDLLRRLEQLAAAIARLEAEIARLEERNKQLKVQLAAPAKAGAVWSGSNGGVQILQSGIPEGAHIELRIEDPTTPKKEK